MRSLFLALAVLFLSSGCSTLQADTTQRVNLLKAGDLSDTQAYVKHWQTPQTTIAQITSVDAPKDINHYLQVNTGNEVRRHYGYIGQKATVKPNTLYTVKAMLRSESKDNGFVQIKRYKDGKETQRFNIGQSDGPRWKTLTDTFNSGDTQIIEILLRWNARQSYLNQTVDSSVIPV